MNNEIKDLYQSINVVRHEIVAERTILRALVHEARKAEYKISRLEDKVLALTYRVEKQEEKTTLQGE